MVPTNIQNLTTRFYQWECRGRGWSVYDTPVDLEPPFESFYKFTVSEEPFVDDGIKPRLLTRLWRALPFNKREEEEPQAEELLPFPYKPKGYLHGISFVLPKDTKVTTEESERLLVMLSTCANPVSFEIIATGSLISLQFVCQEQDARHVESQLKAFFPTCTLADTTPQLNKLLSDQLAICMIDLGLKEEFMRSINAVEDFSLDALTGLFGALEHLQEDERAIVQILFKGTTDPWAQSIVQSVTDAEGKSFFLDAPEMPKLAQTKISAPLYAVVIRTVGQGKTIHQAQEVTKNVARILMQTSQSTTNELIPLSNNGYSDEQHLADIIYRQSHRLGMLLNSKELATLVHIPSASITASKLDRNLQKSKIAPAHSDSPGLLLGINVHQGKERNVSINAEQRLRHMHLIGATGTGKSTLLQNLILQDIKAGRGCAILDPHGDLVDTILAHIPPNRLDDLVIIDPSDSHFPLAFNILLAHTEIEKDVLSSDLVAVFRRLSTSWGDAMNSVFANGILAFLESSTGGTLMDLRRFFVEKPFRNEILKTVSDPSIVYYWNKEYPLLKSNSIGPILTRLDSFLRPKLIRNMVAQKRGLDFERLMDSQKILVVKLSQGLIGTENSYLLGSIFVSKIYQAAMARQNKELQDRKDFYLYVDEFQHFITPSMSHILSGARKYRLGLVLAHQDMQQLIKEDTELAGAITANAGTRICFRLGDTDAKRFEDGFSYFDASDLQNLATGQAIARIDRPEYDFNLSIPAFTDQGSDKAKATVIEKSRARYATPRTNVEAELEYLRQQENPKEEIQEKIVEMQSVELPKTKPKKEKVIQTDESVVEIIEAKETIEYLVKQKAVSQHRYLQNLIKRMAESRGFKAVIELPTPDGKGRVDVSLERNGKRIACEVGVTTTKDWEVHNIEKCLAAGYDMVVAISKERKALDLMQSKVNEQIDSLSLPKVFVLDVEDFFFMLDKELAKEASKETRMKGYRVKVEYEALPEKEIKQKRDAIAKIVLESTKRKLKE